MIAQKPFNELTGVFPSKLYRKSATVELCQHNEMQKNAALMKKVTVKHRSYARLIKAILET